MAIGSARQQALFFECTVSLIDPKVSGRAIIGDVNVRPPVAVEIRARYAQTGPDRGSDSRSFRHIFKRAIAAVVKQARRYRLGQLRRAIIPITGGRKTILLSPNCKITT